MNINKKIIMSMFVPFIVLILAIVASRLEERALLPQGTGLFVFLFFILSLIGVAVYSFYHGMSNPEFVKSGWKKNWWIVVIMIIWFVWEHFK